MNTIKLRTYDEEWPEILAARIEKALESGLLKLDTVNKEYLITVKIQELPSNDHQ